MNRRHSRGFTLLTVVMLVSLATVSALVVLDVIETDRTIEGDERRAREARMAAEGGLMEVLNDRNVLALMPTPDTPSMRTTYTPATDSHYAQTSPAFGELSYDASIELVRVAPMLESSHNVVRAVVYEVTVDARVGGRTGAGVQAEVYKVASARIGVVQPRMHAR